MSAQRPIEVFADWAGLGGPALMGVLFATPSRGKEVFSFKYDGSWLARGHHALDPTLSLFAGPQYPTPGRPNFGLFLDSSPDRWGRVLMRRREAQLARAAGRDERRLLESDFLLGVHDSHRMGALRFRVNERFADDNDHLAAPPWTSLRELENASLQLEKEDARADPHYGDWLRMLIAPGGSLGGARPKASVVDEDGMLWIAKFPSRNDDVNTGAWEMVLHTMAHQVGITVPNAMVRRLGSKHHTYLSQRFDRGPEGRLHYASAMTLLERSDGDSWQEGASYLELVELIQQRGARPARDLEELWRRIVFFMATSNTDDHLRNHGFMLEAQGWTLAPAYDMNPDPHGHGLRLNVSETDNAQDFDLALKVAPYFRLSEGRAQAILAKVIEGVRLWREICGGLGISPSGQDQMKRAFRLLER